MLLMKEVGVKIEIKIEDFKAGGNIFCDYSKGCVTFFRDSPADESEDRSESNPRILFQNVKCVQQGKTI